MPDPNSQPEDSSKSDNEKSSALLDYFKLLAEIAAKKDEPDDDVEQAEQPEEEQLGESRGSPISRTPVNRVPCK